MPSKLESISRGCRLLDAALNFIKSKLVPGVSELKVKLLVNRFLKKNGAQAFAFPTIVAFGNHSASIHHKPTSRKLTDNQIVMIDIGVRINGFCSDETRMFFVGKPKPEWLKIYNLVLKSQRTSLSQLKKAKVSGVIVDAAARKFFPIPHSVGHGLGKMIHDRPRINPQSKDMIKSGDIITVEPGRYFPGRFGIRIEDSVLKTVHGFRLLTKFPKSLKLILND